MLATTFILILAAIFSLVVSKYIPKVSTNYISILVGILCGLIPIIGKHVASFNPEIFMILLVAPLLFYEGQETPLSFVRHHMREIFGVTVIMVLLSTLVAGFSLTYALGLSLPAAFVMAAISTPTDATATSSVSEGLRLPSKITRMLKMESLFNDASGIVLLQATALWLVKNELSIRHTVSEFFISAIGGFFLGFFVSTLIMLFRQKMLRLFEDTVSLQTLIYLLTPFAIYFLAEEASVSGILAVVAAGLVHNSEERAALFTDSRRTFIARETQRMFADLLNSLVFVIFGITSVRIISEQFSWQNISLWGLSGWCFISLTLSFVMVMPA
ncbi:cation:proton antiporter [Ligilactobacillus apodemi]|uniref:cation:proton antiporter n=1 Tax=Ligilactobacillus apodemi TaxID=307126 RepID=UPI000688A434|nr:cation:proton antiporter [Ligilactobacillus apodemi]